MPTDQYNDEIDTGNARLYVKEGKLGTYSGFGDLTVDAWGSSKVSVPQSLFHGLWTFDIPPSMWAIEEDGSEIAESSALGASSTDSMLVLDSSGVSTDVKVHSRRHPRYQPNRGHLYSTAVILPLPTGTATVDFGLFTDENGIFFRRTADGLYACRKSGGGAVTAEQITLPSGIDLTTGNVYDIQYQWRGVGNYKFFVNLTLVHTFSLLGTLTALSIENPALPAAYHVTKGTGDGIVKAGCVDITSENGTAGREQYASTSGAIDPGGSEKPVIAIHCPDQINSETNTRDLRLARISGTSDSNARFTWKVYITRDSTVFTGGTFTAIGDGVFTEENTGLTAFTPGATTNNILTFKTAAWTSEFVDNPSKQTIDFYLVHGDYLVVTADGNGDVIATIEWGEEI